MYQALLDHPLTAKTDFLACGSAFRAARRLPAGEAALRGTRPARGWSKATA
jgi:hypothetical protein